MACRSLEHKITISSPLASIEFVRVNRRAKIWGKIEVEDVAYGRQILYDRSKHDAEQIRAPGGCLTLKDLINLCITAFGDITIYLNLFDLESGTSISKKIFWSFCGFMNCPMTVYLDLVTLQYCCTLNAFRAVVSVRILNDDGQDKDMVVKGSIGWRKIFQHDNPDRNIDSWCTTILFEDYEGGVRVCPGEKFPLPRSQVVAIAFKQDVMSFRNELVVDLVRGEEIIARGSVEFWVNYRDKILNPQMKTIAVHNGFKVEVTMNFNYRLCVP